MTPLERLESAVGYRLSTPFHDWTQTLTVLERRVIDIQFGLINGNAHTLEDMVDILWIDYDKLHSISNLALIKIRSLAYIRGRQTIDGVVQGSLA